MTDKTPGEREAKVREAFEAWADDQGFPLKRVGLGDDYQDLRTQGPWEAWQARAALLEPVGGEGWVMVPKEPTEEMLDAACDVDARAQVERKNLVRFPGLMPHASAGDVWRIQYQAAIAASPKSVALSEIRLLRELLAVIHGDGGHRHAAVGTEQAVMEAIDRWHGARVRIDELEDELEDEVRLLRREELSKDGL